MNTDSRPQSTGFNKKKSATALSPTMAFAALVMGAMAMGVSPVFVRYSEVGPFASAFWRVLLALPILFFWAKWELSRHDKKLQLQFAPAVLASGLFFAGDLVFWHLSIVNTTMANATLMACLAPVWVIMFSGAFIGEPVGRNSYYGLALCLIGAATLVGSSYTIKPTRIIGDIYGFITSIFFGLYFLAMRVARRTKGSGELTFLSTIITTLCLLVIALISVYAANQQFFPKSLNGILALGALGTLSHAGGQGLLAVALGALSAVFSSLVIFIEAVAGAFFGWLVFAEDLTSPQMAGALAILAGIWVARPKQ